MMILIIPIILVLSSSLASLAFVHGKTNNLWRLRSLVLFVVFTSMWAISPIVVSFSPSLIGSRLVFIFAIGTATFAHKFISTTTRVNRDRSRLSVITSLVLSFVTLATPAVVTGITAKSGSFGLSEVVLQRGLLYPVITVWVVGLSYRATRMIDADAIKKLPVLRKLRFAFVLGLAIATLTNVILPLVLTSSYPALFAFISQIVWTVAFSIFAIDYLKAEISSLENSVESKDDFISIASHQLRTPLSIAKLNLDMLSTGAIEKEELSDTYGEIKESIDDMSSIVEDLLEVARISDGSFSISKSSFDLSSLVESVQVSLQKKAEQKGVSFDFNIEEDIVIDADKVKIHQVVINFTENAIEYTHAGGQVDVMLCIRDNKVVFEVSDNGIGVSKDDALRLFEKFERGENARCVRPNGTGIGLYLSKKVLEAHGAELVFKSKLNSGSTFGFIIPLR